MTVGEVVQQTCPRCGSSAAGAPWCPSCGLNLRVHAQDTTAPPPPAPLARRSRRRWFTLAGLLAIGGAIAAGIVLSSGAPATQPVAQTQTQTRSNPPAAPLVTRNEMHDVLQAYVQAYADESPAQLGSLFASSLVRENGNGPVENRGAALADYQHQFAGLTNPGYRLNHLQYASGRGVGVAEGDYVITSTAGRSQGAIRFHFVRRGGRLLIDGIRAVPS